MSARGESAGRGADERRAETTEPAWRACATLVLVVGGFLAAFAIAPHAWLSDPIFVPVPLFGWPARIPPPLDFLWLIALAALLLPLPFLRRPRPLIACWLALFLARAAWDKAAWQPYFIGYVAILASLACLPWRSDRQARGRPLDVARLAVIATYFWAGVAKLDARFVTDLAPVMLAPIERALGVDFPTWFGAVIPAVEIGAAIALATRRLRLVGIVAALLMHVIVLWSIGPFGLEGQLIVWPWNVVMAGLVGVLFFRDRTMRPRDLAWNACQPLHAVALVFFVVLPAVSYVVPVEPYLALRTYSTKIHEGTLGLRESVVARLPDRARRALERVGHRVAGGRQVRVADWVHASTGAYLSPSAASYRHVAEGACAFADRGDDVVLVLVEPPDWRTGAYVSHRLTCDDLGVRH